MSSSDSDTLSPTSSASPPSSESTLEDEADFMYVKPNKPETACFECRLRKRHCDQALPACGRCSRFGGRCIYGASAEFRTLSRDAATVEKSLIRLERELGKVKDTFEGREPLLNPSGLPLQTRQQQQPQQQAMVLTHTSKGIRIETNVLDASSFFRFLPLQFDRIVFPSRDQFDPFASRDDRPLSRGRPTELPKTHNKIGPTRWYLGPSQSSLTLYNPNDETLHEITHRILENWFECYVVNLERFKPRCEFITNAICASWVSHTVSVHDYFSPDMCKHVTALEEHYFSMARKNIWEVLDEPGDFETLIGTSALTFFLQRRGEKTSLTYHFIAVRQAFLIGIHQIVTARNPLPSNKIAISKYNYFEAAWSSVCLGEIMSIALGCPPCFDASYLSYGHSSLPGLSSDLFSESEIIEIHARHAHAQLISLQSIFMSRTDHTLSNLLAFDEKLSLLLDSLQPCLRLYSPYPPKDFSVAVPILRLHQCAAVIRTQLHSAILSQSPSTEQMKRSEETLLKMSISTLDIYACLLRNNGFCSYRPKTIIPTTVDILKEVAMSERPHIRTQAGKQLARCLGLIFARREYKINDKSFLDVADKVAAFLIEIGTTLDAYDGEDVKFWGF